MPFGSAILRRFSTSLVPNLVSIESDPLRLRGGRILERRLRIGLAQALPRFCSARAAAALASEGPG